ncbi:unnamed protein product, partial [Brassica napus]
MSDLCLFCSAQPRSSFSGRSVRCPKPAPWWPVVLGVTSLPRGSVLRSRLIDLVSACRLMTTWGCFLKLPPCMLSLPLGRAVVKGCPTLRMMQNRPLRIPSLVGEKVAIGWTDPLC